MVALVVTGNNSVETILQPHLLVLLQLYIIKIVIIFNPSETKDFQGLTKTLRHTPALHSLSGGRNLVPSQGSCTSTGTVANHINRIIKEISMSNYIKYSTAPAAATPS